MSDTSNTPRTDAEEAKRRAEWLHAHNAPFDWVVLTIDEVAALRAELQQATAERDAALDRADDDSTARRLLLQQDTELAILRARVAELEAKNAKLSGIVHAAYLHCVDGCTPGRARLTVEEQRQLGKDLAEYGCLARVESAAPEISALLAVTPPVTQELLDRLAKAAQAVDDESATPAKHPDTVRLMQTVAEAWTVAREAPELNMCNYDHDDVRLLNDAMIDVYQLLDAARKQEAAR